MVRFLPTSASVVLMPDADFRGNRSAAAGGVAAAELLGLPRSQRLQRVCGHHVRDAVEHRGQMSGHAGVPGVRMHDAGLGGRVGHRQVGRQRGQRGVGVLEGGAGMVHDPTAATLTVVTEITHPAFVLLDPGEQERRVAITLKQDKLEDLGVDASSLSTYFTADAAAVPAGTVLTGTDNLDVQVG